MTAMKQIKLNSSNKKTVQFNYSNEFYVLRHDWPMDTVWNFNFFKSDGPYVEVFINSPKNAETFDAAYGETFEECEDILWKRYQNYINCVHEFSRNSPKGVHYSNGAGFCKHCGMFRSEAFEPETICEECGKNANLVKRLDGSSVCLDCLENTPWTNRLGCTYFSQASFHKYLKEKGCTIEKCSFLEKDGSVQMSYRIKMKDGKGCLVDWTMKKADDGVYEVKEYSGKAFYMFAKIMFGPALSGKYYLDEKGIECMRKKRDELSSRVNNGLLEKDYLVKEELYSMKKLD